MQIPESMKNLISYEFGVKENLLDYKNGKPHYTMTADGIYKISRKDALVNFVKLAEQTSDFKIPFLSDLSTKEQPFEYILPKIPFKHYINILDFFKTVHEKDKTEASCMIYYNLENVPLEIPDEFKVHAEKGLDQDGQWLVYAPIQRNSSGLTDFADDGFDNWLRLNFTKVIECHSHHTMNAFWSGTDMANQKENMFYGVFGHINTQDKFLLKAVANDGVMYNELPVTTLFEFPHVKVATKVEVTGVDVSLLQSAITPEEDIEIPYVGAFNRLNQFKESWIEQHSPSIPTAITTGYTLGNGLGKSRFDDEDYFLNGFNKEGLGGKNLPKPRRTLSIVENESQKNENLLSEEDEDFYIFLNGEETGKETSTQQSFDDTLSDLSDSLSQFNKITEEFKPKN